jgi:hypothetical protein
MALMEQELNHIKICMFSQSPHIQGVLRHAQKKHSSLVGSGSVTDMELN